MTDAPTRSALVIGEAIVDEIEHADDTISRIVGGSPANVALGLARLDVAVTLLTCIAPDADGDAVVEKLAASGANVHRASFLAAKTPVAEVRLAADGQPSYRFEIEWRLPELPDLSDGVGHVHIGSYGAFVDPGADAVLLAAQRAAAAGVPVSFDPNVRAELMGDPDRARTRFAELCRLATIVKLSNEDHEWLFPGIGEHEVVARLLGLGVACVAVTRGERGSLLATLRRRVEVPAVTVADVADSIGAGDSYMAAFIRCAGGIDFAEVDERALTGIGVFCATAAAITVSRPGANPPTAAELELELGAPGAGMPMADA